ncbi:MAG: hypothetical protein GYB68_04185 [Chloroflexi bacterium]|nr:hypothetical protein [Chloroflexota bacterium]
MRRQILVIGVLGLLLVACDGLALEGSEERLISVDGEERLFIVYRPSDEPDMPLVLSLHGDGGDAVGNRGEMGLDEVAEREGFTVAYLEASEGAGIWTTSDVAYFEAVLDLMIDEFDIDSSRVYVVGFSAGGFATHYLGAVLSQRITAITSIGGLMPAPEMAELGPVIREAYERTDLNLPQEPSRPVPVMIIHGLNDQIVPYGGVDSSAQYWADWNGCTIPPTIDSLEDVDLPAEIYENCDDGVSVIVIPFTTEEEDHIVPRGNEPFETAELFWGYVSEFRLD